jgi:hypothetical protein
MHKLNDYNSNTNICKIVFRRSYITKYPATSFGHLCGHHQGNINKNTIPTAEVSEPNNHTIRA